MNDRDLLEKLWREGVKQVQGYACVTKALENQSDFVPTKIAAVGKAASSMMRAALDQIGVNTKGLVVTKYDHSEKELGSYSSLTVIEAAHPVPDENSLRAGAALLEFVRSSTAEDSLLFLISGGASSLVECLPAGMSLAELQAMNEEMLADGLDIHAINAKRREVSLIKGGKLLSHFKGMAVKVLAISDVEKDDINVIGSGIGASPVTAKAGVIETEIIASNYLARNAMEEKAEDLEIEVIVNSENLYGDVFEVANACVETVKSGAPGLYIFGGEPTTILPENPGEGGRNQALAVAMARETSGVNGITILVAGTDGSDGPTNSAGGIATGDSWEETQGGQTALDAANSGKWLKRSGGLFVTGPTGTNVMDVMLVLKR
ncbi:MAG: DUF4147 domain-containing protein [Salaquimonas sp.]